MENKEGMGAILSRENLLRAYKRVVQNGGAAGVDGVEAFQQLGINHEWAMKFAWSRKGGWRLSCSPVMGMTVTEERLKQQEYR